MIGKKILFMNITSNFYVTLFSNIKYKMNNKKNCVINNFQLVCIDKCLFINANKLKIKM